MTISMNPPASYEVLITPLIARDEYGTSINLNSDLNISNFTISVGSIQESIDNGDFDIGVFTLSSITLKCVNVNGKLSGPEDRRGIFPFSRDKAKVTINYNPGKLHQKTLVFRGLIDERATRENLSTNEISLKVLSLNSVFNRLRVPAGIIRAKQSISSSITTLLSLPEIAAVLSFDRHDMNLGLDYEIDNPISLYNQKFLDVLNQLMIASNSVITIDQFREQIFIRPRNFETDNILELKGPHSLSNTLFDEQNILSIKNYNNGIHRVFNSIFVNDIFYSDTLSADIYGSNTKSFNFPFITDPEKIERLAQRILFTFRWPKIEMDIQITTFAGRWVDILDMATVDFPKRLLPSDSTALPTYGSAKYGEFNYPYEYGTEIGKNKIFKVVGKAHNIKNFTTTLKLREIGTNFNDGYK